MMLISDRTRAVTDSQQLEVMMDAQIGALKF